MAGAAWKKSHRFAIAAAIVLLINLVAIAFLGREFDNNVFLFALNLPGLPCGIGVALLGMGKTQNPETLAYAAYVAEAIASSLVWGAVLSRVTLRRARNE